MTLRHGLLALTMLGFAGGLAAQESLTFEHNRLTEAERAAGWMLLFDGESLDGWRNFKAEGVRPGWSVVDGTLQHTEGGGDIVTDREFTDFELLVDWRVSPGGNSGIFYLASEEANRIFEGAPEYQVLDDAVHADGGNPLTSAGSNYALDPAPRGIVHPAGEWNRARIVKEGATIQHWLNGRFIAQYEIGSPAWQARVAASKFAEWPDYGTYETGPIGLQDHGNLVWFRNIKIRRIDP